MKDRWIVHLLRDENDDIVLPIPEELSEKLRWQVGDVLVVNSQGRESLRVENLSVKSMYASKMRRNLNTIIRKINSQTDPLNRVLIKKRRGKMVTVGFVLVHPEAHRKVEDQER